MEELDGFGDSVFDEHALRIAGHQFHRSEFAVVGQQDGRVFVTQFHDRQLAEFALEAGKRHMLFQYFGVAINAGQCRQVDPLPGRIRLTVDLLQHLARASTQGDEEDPFPVQLRKFPISGQLRVKNQLGGQLASTLLPKPNELENLVRLLVLGHARIGVAHDPLFGIAGQEDQNALLGAAAAGNIVFF